MKAATKTDTRRVVRYFRGKTMERKWPFFVALAGMIIASLTNLTLPIYYTKIVDIVQTSGGNRLETVPILVGVLVTMAIIEVISIAGRRMV